MKKIIQIALLICSLTLVAQNNAEEELLVADSTWIKELIKFPVGFAPNLKLNGFEDLRFAKNWSKKDSPEFWSVVYAWRIDATSKPSISEIERYLELYYDGLMNVVNKKKDFKVPKTNVIFESNKMKKQQDYKGSIKVYDAFHSQENLSLNLQLYSLFCEEKNEALIVFRISPKPFKHNIWKRFESVTLKEDICSH